MRRFYFAVVVFCAVTVASAESILPIATGTTWKYQMTQEFGEGVRPSAGQGVKIDADGKLRLPVVLKITGTEKIDGLEVHKFELERQAAVQTIQFLQFNDQGIFEIARGDASGDRLKYDHPQKLLSFPLKAGEKWENHGEASGQKVRETYEMIAQEAVQVPAGKFNAYHLHVVGTEPYRSVVDRWYVPNVGEIKDVTEVASSNGSMKTRISLELTELPTIAGKPETSTAKPAETATASASGPGPGKVKAEEGKEFADELAADEGKESEKAKPSNTPRPDGR